MRKAKNIIMLMAVLLMSAGCGKSDDKDLNKSDLITSTENTITTTDNASEDLTSQSENGEMNTTDTEAADVITDSETATENEASEICIKKNVDIEASLDDQVSADAIAEEKLDSIVNWNYAEYYDFNERVVCQEYISGENKQYIYYHYIEDNKILVDNERLYSFDDCGNVINYKKYSDYDMDEITEDYDSIITYDDNKNMILREIYNNITNETYDKFFYEYDDLGNVIKISEEKNSLSTEFEWDQNGNVIYICGDCNLLYSNNPIWFRNINEIYLGNQYMFPNYVSELVEENKPLNLNYTYDDDKVKEIEYFRHMYHQGEDVANNGRKYVFTYPEEIHLSADCKTQSGAKSIDEALEMFKISYESLNFDLARYVSLPYYLLYEKDDRTFNQSWGWADYFGYYHLPKRGKLNFDEFNMLTLNADELLWLEDEIEEKTHNKVIVKEGYVYDYDRPYDEDPENLILMNIDDRWYFDTF